VEKVARVHYLQFSKKYQQRTITQSMGDSPNPVNLTLVRLEFKSGHF
jgi:hypothetical protein